MLEEELLEKYRNDKGKINWDALSYKEMLSEAFIEKHADKVDWYYISAYQHLSEAFIEKYADKVNWYNISMNQKLSENFIERHADKVYWTCISEYQHLSEKFIERHINEVDWIYISIYQELSENFIKKHADKVNWYCISKHQHLNKLFIKDYYNKIYFSRAADNWLNKSTAFKKRTVEATGLYECHEDFFYAYTGIRSDRYSKFNFQYQYLSGETYECFADGSYEENSFGFSVWTKEDAENYCNELVVKCKIYYKDVARVVHNGGKIRCSRLTILE